MAKVVKSLTNTEIEKAKPKDKEYNLSDGGGLQLRIKTNNSKVWLFNYCQPITKKRTNLKIGNYPAITLAQARKQRDEYKALLSQNIDPQAHRQKLQDEQLNKVTNTFKKVAFDWFEHRKTRANFSDNTAKDVWRMIEKHLFPHFADLPITEITAPLAIKTFKPLQDKGTLETLKRCIQKLNEIMTYALHREIIPHNPTANLSKEFDSPVVKHFKTITPDDLPEFMNALNKAQIHISTRNLILWQLLTMTRPNESATAKFEDIDEKNKIWTLYIKKGIKENNQGRIHKVTLSRQAMALLQEIKKTSHGVYLFPHYSNPITHCNTQTANSAIKRMGFNGKLVAHGLRSIASTYLNEKGYPPDLIEVALSHINSDKVRMAYNRAEYISQRRKMLQDWADFVDECSQNRIPQYHLKIVNE
ncbi:integrase arm-type DNA-binding domain-containing protein [Pasteurella skyensis]|uniref:Integrase arm-type DNA-binding domain-containing protein n=1 Tax=Phocoenobacter skyensis TaxID=97481 RepID=A0AAJ6N8D4_9PAST|nr:integrase arm-type DNA-binding domain-containing protein [Pasteurella skyensis]MDP8161937.1 integrase arm-type DNA-binding domain-containing protein [Pasteurella skyensis]MDP8170286.1 integrase arm-type DNA-binding domain-containing protein [Pasteurella skyensis]MDP8172093.1 integrase arm-type DNA-binding domain-containing protein [Pasteurella skyensis]MDP8176559.1 integrase arm-type DNA-binding domain-containing protein [Pasteurella skyensis]MDP8178447.1 integrase arm-type DNA-binding doma